MIMPVIFTTAPEVYDLPGTIPAGHAGFDRTGAVLRAVRVDVPGAVAQVARYLAAGYCACGPSGLGAIRAEGGYIEWQGPREVTGTSPTQTSEGRAR